MAGGVKKNKAKPRKDGEPKLRATNITVDDRMLLLWLCLRNNGGGAIRWENVGYWLDISREAAKARYLRLAERIEPVMHGIVLAKRKAEAEEREAYIKEQAEKDNTGAKPGEAPADTDGDAAMPDACICGLCVGPPNCEARVN